MMIELFGIAGAVIIVIATWIFNAWIYEKDEYIGCVMLMISLLIVICALATITDIAS